MSGYGPAMAGCGAAVVLELVFSWWWMRLAPKLEKALLVSRAGILGILELVPVHWWTKVSLKSLAAGPWISQVLCLCTGR